MFISYIVLLQLSMRAKWKQNGNWCWSFSAWCCGKEKYLPAKSDLLTKRSQKKWYTTDGAKEKSSQNKYQ
jgi:hypothetical protein